MLKIKSVSVLLLFSIVLFGCQSNNLNGGEDISSIEVYEWDSEELVATIDDKEFIDELVEKLNNAATRDISNADFASPEFELHFKNGNETLFEMGYYEEVMGEGRYLNDREGAMYDVKLQLPIE